MLSDDERLRVASIVTQTVDHRIPVVIGVSAVTARSAGAFSRHARSIGADTVIAMPPYVKKATPNELVEYFRAIAGEAQLPVFIQNYPAPMGRQTLAVAGKRLKGIMGGMAGRFILDEFRRGACGTMPACEVTDVHVAIWNALEAEDFDRARQLHNRLIPLLNIEWMYGAAIYKEVLYRRGVISNPALRGPSPVVLDEFD